MEQLRIMVQEIPDGIIGLRLKPTRMVSISIVRLVFDARHNNSSYFLLFRRKRLLASIILTILAI